MSDTGLSKTDFDALIGNLENTDWDAEKVMYQDWQKIIAYYGFDPEYIRTLICKRLYNAGMTDPSAQRVAILKAITLGIERGNKISKICGAASVAAAAKINELKNQMSLVEDVKVNRKDSINLARVAMCFPTASCRYMEHAARPALGVSKMREFSPNFPAVMCHSSFASIIPNTIDKEQQEYIIRAFLLYQMHFSNAVTKEGFAMNATNVSATRGYVMNGVSSQLVKEQERLDFCVAGGVITNNKPAHAKATQQVKDASHLLTPIIGPHPKA